jgi:fumarate reductase flavoprotein subunit
MARFIGCDPGTLKATIDEYNTFCERGYDALFLKSAECLVPLTKPPYYAIRNKLAILLTHGPLMVNPDMAVVNKNHDAIPGLYAAGADVGGWENDTYANVPRHSSSWTMASGRLAGENAAKYATTSKSKR